MAVTVRFVDIATEQAPVPEQAPLQPAKVDPVAAAAVNVTAVRERYVAEQLPGQLIPVGVDLTEPVPEPATVTVSVWRGCR